MRLRDAGEEGELKRGQPRTGWGGGVQGLRCLKSQCLPGAPGGMSVQTHLGRMRLCRHAVQGCWADGWVGVRAEALAGPALCKPVVDDLSHLEGVPPGDSPVGIRVVPHLPCYLLFTPTQLNRVNGKGTARQHVPWFSQNTLLFSGEKTTPPGVIQENLKSSQASLGFTRLEGWREAGGEGLPALACSVLTCSKVSTCARAATSCSSCLLTSAGA